MMCHVKNGQLKINAKNVIEPKVALWGTAPAAAAA